MTDSLRPLPPDIREVVGDESRRAVLDALDIMNTAPDADFDRLTLIAARTFGAQFSLVTLIDDRRQWFKSCFGMSDLSETPVDIAFCAHTIAAEGDHHVVLDMGVDARFADNPFVVGEPHVRFYAGAPITVRGQRLGTLCVLDTEPRSTVDDAEIAQLVDLAKMAGTLIGLKDEAQVRARTAADLMREEWRHALTLEAGTVGSWVWDVTSGEITCNDIFRQMYDLGVGQIRIDTVLAQILPGDRPAVDASLEAAFEQGQDYQAEMRVATTGRWLTSRGRVYQRDSAGQPLLVMGVTLDISESRRTAEQTRLLLRELNHRVKNTLAMIQSVARQTIRQTPDPAEFIDAFTGRLRTLSDAHVKLADSDWRGVRLYDVLSLQLGPDFLDAPDRAEIVGGDLLLPADHALGLGLVLHELTTNAHKHGAWANQNGIVNIKWEVLDRPGLAMTWKEIGVNGPVRPETSGLGLKLIERGLAKILDSSVTLAFEPSGVRADIWLPLPGEAME